MKDMKRVRDYREQQHNQIMFGQALNNAAVLLSGTAASNNINKYKQLVRDLFQAYKQLRKELLEVN